MLAFPQMRYVVVGFYLAFGCALFGVMLAFPDGEPAPIAPLLILYAVIALFIWRMGGVGVAIGGREVLIRGRLRTRSFPREAVGHASIYTLTLFKDGVMGPGGRSIVVPVGHREAHLGRVAFGFVFSCDDTAQQYADSLNKALDPHPPAA